MYRLVGGGVAVVFLVTSLFAQSPTGGRPSFSGTWMPSDAARSDAYFNVGLSAIPGNGRLTIQQRPDRLIVTIDMPDERMDPMLTIGGKFYSTIIYRIYDTQNRPGGYGAGGPMPASGTWTGNQLTINDARPSSRHTTTTFSLDGDRLKMETRAEVDKDRSNTVTEWFTKVK